MKKTSHSQGRKICPLVQVPYSNCFCVNLTSSSAEAAIYFCGGHYEKCDIFKKHQNLNIQSKSLENVSQETRERSKP